jgi:hypothetical protein
MKRCICHFLSPLLSPPCTDPAHAARLPFFCFSCPHCALRFFRPFALFLLVRPFNLLLSRNLHSTSDSAGKQVLNRIDSRVTAASSAPLDVPARARWTLGVRTGLGPSGRMVQNRGVFS